MGLVNECEHFRMRQLKSLGVLTIQVCTLEQCNIPLVTQLRYFKPQGVFFLHSRAAMRNGDAWFAHAILDAEVEQLLTR